MCEIFPSWVAQAGPEKKNTCYPCYTWYILGEQKGKDMAVAWLEIRRNCGETEMVDQWYRWKEENGNSAHTEYDQGGNRVAVATPLQRPPA